MKVIYCDSSTNEACIVPDGREPIVFPYYPPVTNNVGEYRAVLRAFAFAYNEACIVPDGVEWCIIKTDSKLVVEQGNGRWKCRKEHLKPFCELVRQWLHACPKITLEWVSREENPAGKYLEKRK